MLRKAIGFVLVSSMPFAIWGQKLPPLPKQPTDASRRKRTRTRFLVPTVLVPRAALTRAVADAITRRLTRCIGAIALVSMGLGLATPALAQPETLDPAVDEALHDKGPCEVVERSREEYPETFPPGYLEGIDKPIRALFAHCNGTGTWLGLANSYQVIVSPAMQASVVELVWLGRKRLMLVSPGADNGLTVEDLTGLFASKAGRALTSRIDDLAFDYAGFAETGSIGITGSRLAESHTPDAEGAPGIVAVPLAESYSIKDHIDREKARRATVTSALVGEAQ